MFKKIDSFSRNVIIVFAGTALLSFLNLVFQLLLAHRLDPVDFAGLNSLLSLYMIFSAPFVTLQTGIIKYTSEFRAKEETEKIKNFLSGILTKILLFAVLILLIFYYAAPFIMAKLQIASPLSLYIFTAIIFSSCLSPVFSGAMLGLQLFNWFTVVSVISGAAKLALAVLFIQLGYKIAGALGALFISAVIGLAGYYFILRKFIVFAASREASGIKAFGFKGFFFYLFPVAVSTLCFMVLVSWDMVMVKYYFSPEQAGLYSLAQMLGKIFLFLPGAISIVMFPRTSGLHAKNLDTAATLKRALFYAVGLCGIAAVFYNIWPQLSLTVITGKFSTETVRLGRLFSFSMSFFALLYLMISYFLSKRDWRFLKWLLALTSLQVIGIAFFHNSLFQVQSVLCISAFALFCIHLALFFNLFSPRQ